MIYTRNCPLGRPHNDDRTYSYEYTHHCAPNYNTQSITPRQDSHTNEREQSIAIKSSIQYPRPSLAYLYNEHPPQDEASIEAIDIRPPRTVYPSQAPCAEFAPSWAANRLGLHPTIYAQRLSGPSPSTSPSLESPPPMAPHHHTSINLDDEHPLRDEDSIEAIDIGPPRFVYPSQPPRAGVTTYWTAGTLSVYQDRRRHSHPQLLRCLFTSILTISTTLLSNLNMLSRMRNQSRQLTSSLLVFLTHCSPPPAGFTRSSTINRLGLHLTVRLFCAHGPRWCLELELDPRLEPRGTGRPHRESGKRKTCCLLGNRLSEVHIISYFCDFDREKLTHTSQLHS